MRVQTISSSKSHRSIAKQALDREMLGRVLETLERSGDRANASETAEVEQCIRDARRVGEKDEQRIVTLAVVLFRARRAQRQVRSRLHGPHFASNSFGSWKNIEATQLDGVEADEVSPTTLKLHTPSIKNNRDRRRSLKASRKDAGMVSANKHARKSKKKA